MKKTSISAVAMVAFSALLAIGVLTFAGPCVHDDGSVSMCFGASRVLVCLGAAGVVAGIARLLVASPLARRVASVATLVLGVAAAIAPGNVLPLCMMATMRCQAVMRPFAIAMGACLAVASVVDLVLAARTEGAA